MAETIFKPKRKSGPIKFATLGAWGISILFLLNCLLLFVFGFLLRVSVCIRLADICIGFSRCGHHICAVLHQFVGFGQHVHWPQFVLWAAVAGLQ